VICLVKIRVAAVAAAVMVGSASVAFGDECTNLAFAYAQAANSMTPKDLAALGRCVNEQLKKNQQQRKQAERTDAQGHAKKPTPSGKKRPTPRTY
jgi:hypothetical protein